MTAQRHDILLLEEASCAVVAIEREWPFHPRKHGLPLDPQCSSCCRGYVATYAVRSGFLLLDALALAGDQPSAPPWNDIYSPKAIFRASASEWEYRNIGVPIRYSGGIVIGFGLIGDLYRHMGFQRAHCFDTVTELGFDHGRLVHRTDHSASMALVRSRIRAAHETRAEDDPPVTDCAERVRAAFSMDYEDKWRYPLPQPTSQAIRGQKQSIRPEDRRG